MPRGKAIKADWAALQIEYAQGNLSIRQLAEKHCINFHSLRHHSNQGKWRKNSPHSIMQQVGQKIVQTLADQKLKLIEDIQSEAIPIARKLQTEVNRSIDSMFGEAIDSAHLNGLAQALGKANNIALVNAGWVAPVSKLDVTSNGQSLHDHSIAMMASIAAMQEQGQLNTAAIDVEALLLEQKQEQEKTGEPPAKQ